ncbi:uncharacterized protein LOC125668291 isoform X2 [Ostrea edulis]|uniref:uncharacterized protein LOC125668291 isoform X2 n=1 Tax=Ostrea edulis TaxID=37623 RepID=UPI0024AEF69B|nr:uncharacterized protein LOC125668291 isoform X2 [Ostrea edulis]
MSTRKLELSKYVRMALENELKETTKAIDEDDINALLKTDGIALSPRETIIGYPSYPLCREISNMLQQWMENKYCPVSDLPKYELLDEQSYTEAREANFKTITPLLVGLQSLWELWSDEETAYRVKEILLILGKRGMLDLLGVRKTVGTKDLWPVSRELLVKSFTAKHGPNSEISVGARALSKHFHRDSSTSWWGGCTGNNATWINIHWLPHDVYIIEARQEEGYGARWTADGSSFRGFLEPQMVDGHAVGWKH